MIKRIRVEQLRVGMFLHELGGSWLNHPFWKSKFVLSSSEEIRLIHDAGIEEVSIDISRGRDVDVVVVAAEPAAVDELPQSAQTGTPQMVRPVSLEEEVAEAARICARAKGAVTEMFQEARLGKAVDAREMMPVVEEISNSVLRNPGAIVSLARLKTADEYTYMHSVAVCALMVALARQLELDEAMIREAGLGGLLHDLGKALMPPEILNKPGALTLEEFAVIKRHPEEGARLLLERQGADAIPFEVCLHHHEKMDGSGYPHGLKGEAISLVARMGAVCDVYDAITSNRPYKRGWGPAESLRKMAEWSKGHFDPHVFQAFVKSLGIYPIGSLVRLESGRLAVVVEQSAKSLLTPRVKVFYSTKSRLRIAPKLLDLSRSDATDRIVDQESPANWDFADLDELWSGLPDLGRR